MILMIYTELTVKAMEIAYNAHHGQKDKCGAPYVFHPFHLAEQMDSEYTVCAALLHDVVEDTDISLAQLADIFPDEIINAVRLLTHSKGTDYEEYIRKIASDPVAKAVKLADLAHNSDPQRAKLIDEPEAKTAERMEIYEKAKAILEEK